ncbi:MAG: FxLYD domain-containing protein [Nitrososphaerales archaeon]
MDAKVVSFALILILTMSIFTYGNVFADIQVKIAGHRMSIDSSGLMHISGIVENEGEQPVGSVHVTAYLFDQHGNGLHAYDTVTLFRTILPGYIAPFDIPISDRSLGDKIASYTLLVDWKDAKPKSESLAFSEPNTFIWTHIDPRTLKTRNPHGDAMSNQHDSIAHTETSGILTNTGELITKMVKVAAIWYDERGQFYSYDMQVIAQKLARGDGGRFVIMTHPAMGYYSLVAESEHYVSMLTKDGEKMFRVYDANKDNQLPPGVDTMSITDILVTDVENKMISRIPVKTKPPVVHFTPKSGELTKTITEGAKKYPIEINSSKKLNYFNYEQATKTITVSMEKNSKYALDPVHVEIVVPNEFEEFVSSGRFEATFNDVPLDGKIFFIDPDSYKDKTSLHYIISFDDMMVLSKQMTEENISSEYFVFTVRSLGNDPALNVKVGEQIQLQSSVKNNLDKKQQFVYLLQIKDSKGATVMLSWIEGQMPPMESIDAILSWTPESNGIYTMQIFLWESLTYKSTMSSNFVQSVFIVSD